MDNNIYALQIEQSDGDQIRLSSGEYFDNHYNFRPHLGAITTEWSMQSAFGGNTEVTHSSITINNPSGVWDGVNFSGAGELRKGDPSLPFANLKPILSGAISVASVDHEHVTLGLFDAQYGGLREEQATILDKSSDGFGNVLPEIWGAGIQGRAVPA